MNKEQETTIKIQALIDTGRLPAGERLPSERKLCEMIGVSRGEIRKALQKLEFSGVIHTKAQSGSYVTEHYFSSLVSTRILLEGEATRLCALNSTPEDIRKISEACSRFKENPCVEEDMAFHRAIIAGAHNNVLLAVWQTVTADVASYYQKYSVCSPGDPVVIKAHDDLVQAIAGHKPEEAVDVLTRHLDQIRELSIRIDFNNQ